MTWAALFAWTVESASPWKTMVGTPLAASLGTMRAPFIAINAAGRSVAAPAARPEWTPTAAYKSG
jgi:hypothetical protein